MANLVYKNWSKVGGWWIHYCDPRKLAQISPATLNYDVKSGIAIISNSKLVPMCLVCNEMMQWNDFQKLEALFRIAGE